MPDKRQRSKSSQFRKLALSVSEDDSKFYLTTSYSRPITLALLGQKTYPFFEEPCSLNLLFQTVDYKLNSKFKRLRWSRGSVLAFGTQVRGFKPGRSRRIFRGEKILSTPSFGRICRGFAACKRSLKCFVEVEHLRQNCRPCFSPT